MHTARHRPSFARRGRGKIISPPIQYVRRETMQQCTDMPPLPPPPAVTPGISVIARGRVPPPHPALHTWYAPASG